MLPSYGKIYALGKSEVRNIFDFPVIVQEKVDGSQFSFMVDPNTGALRCGSRNRELDINDEKLGQFAPVVNHLKSVADRTQSGIVFRGETLARPKANILAYERVPRGHLVLFDATYLNRPNLSLGPAHMGRTLLEIHADDFGVDVVPQFEANVQDREAFDELLKRPSFLGGIMEGLVFKSHVLVDPFVPSERLKAKYVQPAFHEVAGSHKRHKKPGQDWLTDISERYATDARFHKAVQHLRDDGKLKEDARDIGPLMAELARDLREECTEEIMEAASKFIMKAVLRQAAARFPKWYKDELLKKQFEGE